MPDENPFAQRLIALRENAKLTKYALAKLAGITATNLQRLEAGADPHLSTVVALARALGVQPCDLICSPGKNPTNLLDGTNPAE